ncbi:transketolase [Leptomonas pyrrhocoris]|uniref:Transketolase n=1 Tax=Leptomonas pyrrhocoris TaxID=157538 RepID=A0A0M9FZX2_LEPPY|nr:transketolase [Leptomonas pyrrhocoris]XP_015657762.1 transketolase [Leptomonas pyrrhocoris]KPA79316.1 transketolase [Leptomonas pyrrhocoris]KPA79323.1 transketolase [Leptomonas pyrrhocoris]|eukprot:XP_015657755.1 transketolase [Leptomonas pyrrhocoris]
MATPEQIANCIRCLAADIVQGAKSGHPGTPMGMAPVSTVLWTEIMKYNCADPSWADRDRFVLSNGHACALQYSLLHLAGYDLTIDDLKQFRQEGARTPGHPERFVTAGVEVTTGPLGQGVCNAVGLAMAEAHLAATFNKPGHEIVNHYTYAFCGDGCLMEGVCQEALSLAGHLALEKLIVVYDSNHICIDGSTDLSFTEQNRKKYEAVGFHVIEVPNADTDFDALRKAFAEAKATHGKPKMIIQTSTIGYGSSKQGTEKVHGAPLGDEEIAKLKTKFGRDPSKKYFVEEEVYAAFRKHVEKCVLEQKAWEERVEKYKAAYPAEGAAFVAQLKGELPAGWEAKLPLNDKSIATRKASENCLAALFPAVPALVGGSADLTPSNLTRPASANLTDFEPGNYAGRYLRFGVREHSMAAIVNGLDAHGGVIPFGATFLNFIGYALGAIRLAALSHHRSIFVATHDSIGLGEDGPTHQPVELVAALRAMPNLLLLRPGDQTETSGAWAVAVANARRPSVVCLSRQNTVPQPGSSIEGVKKGAYKLNDVENPQLVIVASGSEVSLAVDAAKALAGEARVSAVSMPCQELFDEQSEAYQRSVFPEGVPVVSVEPYVSFGWEKYSHVHIGMPGFGASAPAEALYKRFGITLEHVTDAGRKLMARFPNGNAPLKNSAISKM